VHGDQQVVGKQLGADPNRVTVRAAGVQDGVGDQLSGYQPTVVAQLAQRPGFIKGVAHRSGCMAIARQFHRQ
jgi:hypothetical protein